MECLDDLEDAGRSAGLERCADRLDAVIFCVREELVCRDGVVAISGCDEPLEGLRGCAGVDVMR